MLPTSYLPQRLLIIGRPQCPGESENLLQGSPPGLTVRQDDPLDDLTDPGQGQRAQHLRTVGVPARDTQGAHEWGIRRTGQVGVHRSEVVNRGCRCGEVHPHETAARIVLEPPAPSATAEAVSR